MAWGLQRSSRSPLKNGENSKKVRSEHHSGIKKKPATPHGYWLSDGGELGIRTLGPLRDTAFRVLHLRPLGQLSSQNKFGMYFFVCCFPKGFRALYFNKHSLKSQSPAHVFRLVSAKALLYNKTQADFL